MLKIGNKLKLLKNLRVFDKKISHFTFITLKLSVKDTVKQSVPTCFSHFRCYFTMIFLFLNIQYQNTKISRVSKA